MRPDLFNFGDIALEFDQHISQSIPGLAHLRETCVALSRRFVQPSSRVIDVGCSAGTLLREIYYANVGIRDQVNFIGIDAELAFKPAWESLEIPGVTFAVADCLSYPYRDISLATVLFTVQFLPTRAKAPLLNRLRESLIPGGACVVAEKVYAQSGRVQDAMTFPYYDRKRAYFSADEILDKERGLRGQMTLWTDAELRENLKLAGFAEIELIWANFPFVAYLAVK